jgi:sec-independent protein translocase protein TatA
VGDFGPWHLLIIAIVFVLLFGARRLPDGARSLGRSMRILKSELKGMHDDDDPEQRAQQAGQVPAPLPPAAVAPAPAPVVTPTPQPTAVTDPASTGAAAGDPVAATRAAQGQPPASA